MSAPQDPLRDSRQAAYDAMLAVKDAKSIDDEDYALADAIHDALAALPAEPQPPIDVERLAAALDSVDIDEFDTLGAFDSTGYATAILAALRDEP